MRSLLAAIAVLGALGCGDGLPIDLGTAPYKVHDQDKAILLTESWVEHHYDRDLGRVYDEAVIHWTDTRCPYRLDQYAVVYKDRCFYGRMWACDSIYVALSNRDPERTCGSALVHEFGHCLRGRLGLDPQLPCPGMDAPHKDQPFWDVVGDAHEESCARGW